MKLWIDDLRAPSQPGWVWAQTLDDAMAIVGAARVGALQLQEISFDHDLGEDEHGNDIRTVPVANLIEESAYRGELPPIKWSIHSANPAGRKNLRAAMESADRYWSKR